MNAFTSIDALQPGEDAAPFYAPAPTDMLDGLMGQYQRARAQILAVDAIMTDRDHRAAVSYFIGGNRPQSRISGELSVDSIFKLDGALAALNADYWSRALALTDVLDLMPQARRTEWQESITNRTTPDFEEETVRATLESLLSARGRFFAERVDGIFRALSGTHVTNSPAAFGKRMIISYMTDANGFTNYARAGFIHDLRAVIAKFMGRDEPKYAAAARLVEVARSNPGVWHEADGGALRLRSYKVGTAHLEVHPDMAWRLNAVLASLYPSAIPASFRTKPARRAKGTVPMGRPLPFAVVEVLANGKFRQGEFHFGWGDESRSGPARDEAELVISALGGVVASRQGVATFDYDAAPIIQIVILTGCLPDQKAHQYYPTPATVAAAAVELAQIGPDHQVLEPSAGQGHLAALLPQERLTCVELAPLHVQILRQRGFETVQGDFIRWAASAPRFDRVVMNPPFADGRALAHLEAAAQLVEPGGRLVAVLPASMRGKDVLPGWTAEWSRVFANEFAGTSVAVAIVAADRPRS